MSRLAVICNSSIETLAAMASAIAAGAQGKGAHVRILDASCADTERLSCFDAAAFGFSPACEQMFWSVYVKALEKLPGRRVSVFGVCPDNADGFADMLCRIGSLSKTVWKGACFCADAPSAETLAACRALGETAVRAREERPDLADTVPIIFSTITGNAYKLAAAVSEAVPNHVGPYNIRYINDEVIEKFDTFILSYWCNHGTADDDTIELIRRMRGKKLIVVGTLGAARDSKHANDVCARVEALASENNTLLGHYLCRGSIDLRRTAARMRIPEGQKGHLSAERFEKQKLSLGHPDEAELAEAKAAVVAFLKKL